MATMGKVRKPALREYFSRFQAMGMATATAAALWVTGAVGLAVAWGRFEIALLLAALTFCTLQFIYPIKERLRGDEDERG